MDQFLSREVQSFDVALCANFFLALKLWTHGSREGILKQ